MASNSAIEALRPFIFQLPAISGRMGLVISEFPSRLGLASASRARAAVPDAGWGALPGHSAPGVTVATRRPSLYMLAYQLGDARLRKFDCGFREFPLGETRVPPANKLDPCFEECAKPHQTGSAKSSWPR